MFEKTTASSRRKVCKDCYKVKKAQKAKERSAKIDKDTIPRPTACIECSKGYPEVEFKWRSDVGTGGWRPTCNECYNSRKYYKTYRDKKLAEDPEAYRAHNNIMHRDWVSRNQQRIQAMKAKYRKSIVFKFKTLVSTSKKRNVPVNVEEAAELQEMFLEPCHWCGFEPCEEESLNGLDRLDANGSYSVENCVACCHACNMMKACQTPDEFICNIRKIVQYLELSDINEDRSRLPIFGNQSRSDNKEEKLKINYLSRDLELNILLSPCYLCGQAPSFGIDRVDPNDDYTSENSKPCCSNCNYMKKDLDLDAFKKHITHINMKTRFNVLTDTIYIPIKMNSKRIRVPIAVEADGEKLIFPSLGCAERVLKKCPKIVEDSTMFRGTTWSVVPVSEYKKQLVDKDTCKAFVERAMRTLSSRR
jgi:hypothetical protein